ncbi:MAG TPA: Zn-dependent hydrolase [Gemmatimonadales bacterium]
MRRRDLLKAAAVAGAASVLPRAAFGQDSAAWRVNHDRVNGWLKDLSRFGANPGGGVSRVGFSDFDVEARAWLHPLMQDSGLTVRTDPAGNIIGELPGTDPSLKPLLFGSHIDSVLNGGNYDGDVGTLGAIEVIRTLREKGYRNRHPLWVTMWADEESGLTGSRGFLGLITADELSRPYRGGLTLGECIRKVGGDPSRMGGYRFAPGSIAGYLELHIEQGGTLDREGLDIGVVEGIVGIIGASVTITGFANHAGTTAMAERKNALLAASELVLALDRIVKSHPGRQVGTVGQLAVKPGASNVIPGEVTLSIELRDLDMARLDGLWEEVRAEGDRIMARQGTTWSFTPRPRNEVAMSDPRMREVVSASAKQLGLTAKAMPSGAGHDAQNLARIGPMGMIFVPSVGGISHSPREFTSPEDVTNGVNVLLQSVLRLDGVTAG